MSELLKSKCIHDKEHFVANQGFVNLTIGAPGPKTLSESRKIFREATIKRLSSDHDECDTALFQYGTEEGPSSFIHQLSRLLSAGYNDFVDPKNLFLTGGASAGFFLSTAILLSKDQSAVIFIESSTYFLVLRMIKDHGYENIIPIPMQDDGVDVDVLEDAMKKEFDRLDIKNRGEKERFWAMFYTIPTYHNPTGSCLSDSKCKKVIQLSRKFNVLVVCDDVYNLLHYENESIPSSGPPKRLVSYDNKDDHDYGGGHVISNGSFSKILAPGFRVGWIESSETIVQKLVQCGMVHSGGSVNAVTSGIIATAIELGLLSKHIEQLRKEYGKRMRSALKLLNDNLPDGFKCNPPSGGYFLWITGPFDSFDSEKFVEFCLEHYKVKVMPGYLSTSVSSSANIEENKSMLCRNAIRVSISYYEHEEFCDAILNLCKACKEFVK